MRTESITMHIDRASADRGDPQSRRRGTPRFCLSACVCAHIGDSGYWFLVQSR